MAFKYQNPLGLEEKDFPERKGPDTRQSDIRQAQRQAWFEDNKSSAIWVTPEFRFSDRCMPAVRIGNTRYIAAHASNATEFYNDLLELKPQPPTNLISFPEAYSLFCPTWEANRGNYKERERCSGAPTVSIQSFTDKSGERSGRLNVWALPPTLNFTDSYTTLSIEGWEKYTKKSHPEKNPDYISWLYNLYAQTDKDTMIVMEPTHFGCNAEMILIFLLVDYYDDIVTAYLKKETQTPSELTSLVGEYFYSGHLSSDGKEKQAYLENINILIKFIHKYYLQNLHPRQIVNAVNIACKLKKHEAQLKKSKGARLKDKTNLVPFSTIVADAQKEYEPEMPFFKHDSQGGASQIGRFIYNAIKKYPLRIILILMMVLLANMFIPTDGSLGSFFGLNALILMISSPLIYMIGPIFFSTPLGKYFSNFGDFLEKPFRVTYQNNFTKVALFLLVGAAAFLTAYFLTPLIVPAMAGLALLGMKMLIGWGAALIAKVVIASVYREFFQPRPTLLSLEEMEIPELKPKPATDPTEEDVAPEDDLESKSAVALSRKLPPAAAPSASVLGRLSGIGGLGAGVSLSVDSSTPLLATPFSGPGP